MQFPLKILAVFIVGTLLGLLATYLIVVRGPMPSGIADGPWTTSLAIGSPQSDPYTRASVAVHGLLALNRQETIYYTAMHDSGGAALDGRCRYLVEGRDPDARWWSITAYGPDDYLIANGANRYSVSKTSVARKNDGSFAIEVGGEKGGVNWIPAGQGRFSLTLRLYNPGPLASMDPGATALPSIRKMSCP